MEHGDESSAALSWLWDARVQRVDGPSPGCFSLALFRRGDKQYLVLMLGSDVRGLGTVVERPKGEAASPFVQRLRRQLEGGRLARADWLAPPDKTTHATALLLTFERGREQTRLVADFDARTPNLLLLRADDTVAGAADEKARRERFPARDTPYTPSASKGIARIVADEQLRAAGADLLSSGASRREEVARTRLLSEARAALKRAERKADAIRGDVARAESAPRLRREGELLLCNLDRVPRGATSVQLLDETREPPEWVEVALDPARSAQQLAQHRFERARKLERGVTIASARLAEAEAEVERLRTRLAQLATEPLDALTARDAGGAAERAPARRGKPPARVPYRVFLSAASEKILVGKGGADNDTLTLTVARPHDHWLHVRDGSGAHVVVPLERKTTIGQELLLDAAHLAAHFSKQRSEPTVEIRHTERRFVRKLRGSAPGTVNVDRERVFVLRVGRERLARLLASERT